MNYANSMDLLVNGTVETVPILDTTKAPAIVETASGESVSIQDSADAPLAGLSVFGKATQAGTPSPESPVPIEIAGIGGTVNISITGGTSETQSLQLSITNGLPGIPVSSGGNYTDASGQQWICDVIDYKIGKYIQRVLLLKIDNFDQKSGATSPANSYYVYLNDQFLPQNPSANNVSGSISNYFNEIGGNNFSEKDGFNVYQYENKGYILFNFYSMPEINTVDMANQWLSTKELYVIYELETPIITDLSPEEIEAYKQLASNYPNTNIFSDSTPQVGIEVDYVADTKAYIDNKFNAIAQQMLN